ncbi:conserved exported hypothetical protein [Desulfamplus magnetovallimortis]|uniref:Uncharacterized protein n=1 Tax=Desulfamplus magnetovallimortis TaxID=1246637 RepID=A0A1W1HH05_9BACT|nr:NAD(P)/FAD-dependent oxidoreductase [Desulfamplus magnetovallimortis]SLM31764.1 conserved exported hypothetical protein [Desulfamplus magnetovallimortis]
MSLNINKADVVIVGAGASGLMCAAVAGQRGRKVLVLDHAKRAGTKILMSGGSKCNFTNYEISARNYFSNNPHFCKSALKQFSQWDFIEIINRYNIPFEEREHGQLFCINSAVDILDMLLAECKKGFVEFQMNCAINDIALCCNNTQFFESMTSEHGNQNEKSHCKGVDNAISHCKGVDNAIDSIHSGFNISTDKGIFYAKSLVISTGGLSIPSSGATPFGLKTAEKFGISIVPPRAGLVPLTLQPGDKKIFSDLSGIALEASVICTKHTFRENILFTHRGLSGPAILQISSCWNPGDEIMIDLLPDLNLFELLVEQKKRNPNKKLKTVLSKILPKRLISALLPVSLEEKSLQEISLKTCGDVSNMLQKWRLKPGGTEGYRTAEVTLGGVDCNEISSKTMESNKIKGLFFTGEVLDIAGWLGGYNLQWAWSSGWCAGQTV